MKRFLELKKITKTKLAQKNKNQKPWSWSKFTVKIVIQCKLSPISLHLFCSLNFSLLDPDPEEKMDPDPQPCGKLIKL